MAMCTSRTSPISGFLAMDTFDHGEFSEIRLGQLVSAHSNRWFQTSDEPPEFLERFSVRQKLERQREVELAISRIPGSLDRYIEMDIAARERARARMHTLLAKSFSHAVDPRLEGFVDDCERITELFISQAREFDPDIGDNDIHQALRNLWVFNSIQLYLARPVALTPSSFAYSLLYPYADNHLDAAGHDGAELEDFLEWLSRMLLGEDPETSDAQRKKLGQLIHMIEGEFPRTQFRDVHWSLRAIHAAQRRGLLLRDTISEFDEQQLLPITVGKGGASVLADAFLAAGVLDGEASDTMFAYGVQLQLIDDLQDMEEDARTGYSSPFTRAIKAATLEKTTNRLLHSVKTCQTLMSGRASDRCEPVCSLIMQSCTFLIFKAIAQYRKLYNDSYLSMIDEFTPLPLSYLASLRSRIASQPRPARTACQN
jgi:hypothetical protein